MKGLEEWLRLVPAVVAAMTAVVIALRGGAEGLKGVLVGLGLGEEQARILAWTAFVVLAALVLWFGRGVLPRRSVLQRPERFDLRVRKPEDLLGRTADVENLAVLVADRPLVFVDGRSGAGKSALVEHGLLPTLRERGRLLPFLVSRHGSDWSDGPLLECVSALWEALSADERKVVDVETRPAVGSVTLQTWMGLLTDVARKLGKLPLLIFDQLDDYQTVHRGRFLGPRGDWITPRQLLARNPFWKTVAAALRDNTLHLLLITRSDASAGLFSVRLTEEPAPLTVHELEQKWLPQLLGGLTSDDGKGAVVARPENGWDDLKEQLVRDLPRNGTVLPQQLRILLLGLSSGPPPMILSSSRYRAYGGAPGTEGRYISAAIRVAAQEAKVTPAAARALLGRLVERGVGSSDAKTQTVAEADLARDDAERARDMLASLARQEVVRRSPDPTAGGDLWQLDHDYLARAVLAEERAANLHATILREAAAEWRRAGGDMWQRWRRRLPLLTQVRLFWARLCGRFRYGPDRSFALASLVPYLLAVVLIVGPTWYGWRELVLRSEARTIVFGLEQNDPAGRPAVMELWRAPASVRKRFLPILLDAPARLQNGGTEWVDALVGLDFAESRHVCSELLHRLDSRDIDSPEEISLIQLLGAVAPRLDPTAAKDLAADLRKRLTAENMRDPLEKESQESPTRLSMIKALGAVAPRLDPAAAKELAVDLRKRLATVQNTKIQEALIKAMGAVAPRLDPTAAKDLADDLLKRLATVQDTPSLQDALCAGISRLDPKAAKDRAYEFMELIVTKSLHGSIEDIDVLHALASRLGPMDANDFATDLRRRLATVQDDMLVQDAFIDALGAVAPQLDSKAAKDLADDLRKRLTAEDLRYIPDDHNQDSIKHDIIIEALAAVAPQLDPTDANDLAADLRRRHAKGGPNSNSQLLLIRALGAVAPRLDPKAANDLADDLRKGLANAVSDSSAQALWIDALSAVAPRLDPVSAKNLADDLVKHLGTKQPAFLVKALGAVAPRLDPTAAEELIGDFRKRLGAHNQPLLTHVSLIGALAAVASGQDTAAAEDLANDLRVRWADNGSDSMELLYALSITARAGLKVEKTRRRAVQDILLYLSSPFFDEGNALLLPHSWEPNRDIFAALESASGTTFDGDVMRAWTWAGAAYHLQPDEIRP